MSGDDKRLTMTTSVEAAATTSADADGLIASNSDLSEIIQTFPQEELVYGFGYGSGVFSQNLTDDAKGDEGGGGMLDLILVVQDANNFHKSNMQLNPHHYASWLRWSGASMASSMQRKFLLADAKVLFHVVDDPVRMKYGVVQLDDLLKDLTQWEHLYLAGRLHKPTLPIIPPPDEFFQGQQLNLKAAVAAALLLISGDQTATNNKECQVSWSTFYSRIASLSYTGDFRMRVGGEDPLKITKLVDAPGQLQRFHAMYQQDILRPLEQSGLVQMSQDNLRWDVSSQSARNYLWGQLPRKLQVQHQQNRSSTSTSQQDVKVLAVTLAGIVAPKARHQSFKGIFTLGFRKSIQYASAKLSKGLFRKK
jgi:translocator assembly and maintenance protein 41